MSGLVEHNPAIFLPLFFFALWLAISTILSLVSGWFRLMEQYPDQPDVEPNLRLRLQSGAMGPGLGVSMHGILSLSVCANGLRVGIMRVFGPFCRSFLVPWENIAIVRKPTLLGSITKLQFGNPVVGTLRISSITADTLARAAKERWPEPGPFPAEKPGAVWSRWLAQWIVSSSIGTLIFILVPLAVAPVGSHPPIAVAILFPAVAFGLVLAIRFLLERA